MTVADDSFRERLQKEQLAEEAMYRGDPEPFTVATEREPYSQKFEVVHEGADLAYTVSYERGELALDGGEQRRQTIRVTQVYRRDGDRWWLVHRHGDFAPLDESPPSPAAS